MPQTNEQGETSGEWLLAQKGREGRPRLPAARLPDDVRKRLNEMQADGGMHAVVDDAETGWLGYWFYRREAMYARSLIVYSVSPIDHWEY